MLLSKLRKALDGLMRKWCNKNWFFDEDGCDFAARFFCLALLLAILCTTTCLGWWWWLFFLCSNERKGRTEI